MFCLCTILPLLCITLQIKELHTEELQRLTSSQNRFQEQLVIEKEQVLQKTNIIIIS